MNDSTTQSGNPSRRDMLWLSMAGLAAPLLSGAGAWAADPPAAGNIPFPDPLVGLPQHEFLRDKLPPSQYAKKLFDTISRKADYQGTPVLFLSSFSQDCQNAYATCLPSQVQGQVQTPVPPPGLPGLPGPQQMFIPIIVYNPAFMSQIAFATNNEYVPAYVLAHELGHIVCRHVDPNNPAARMEHPWKHELEADEFAGGVVARLNAKAPDLELAHRVMISTQWMRFDIKDKKVRVMMADKTMRVRDLISGSDTHPDAIKRIQAIARGWKAGGGEGDVETDLRDIFTRIVEEAIRWDPEG